VVTNLGGLLQDIAEGTSANGNPTLEQQVGIDPNTGEQNPNLIPNACGDDPNPGSSPTGAGTLTSETPLSVTGNPNSGSDNTGSESEGTDGTGTESSDSGESGTDPSSSGSTDSSLDSPGTGSAESSSDGSSDSGDTDTSDSSAGNSDTSDGNSSGDSGDMKKLKARI